MRPWPVGAVVLPAAGGMLALMLAAMLATVQRCVVCTLGFPRGFQSQPTLPFLGSSAWVFKNPEIPKHGVCPLMGSSATPRKPSFGNRMNLPMFDTPQSSSKKHLNLFWYVAACGC